MSTVMALTGFALLRGVDGDIRTSCTAALETPESRTLDRECNPEQ